jgi:hypothetical protein
MARFHRLFDRSDWEPILRDFGAKPLEGKGSLNTAEWRRAPWGEPFVVPVDEDGRSLEEDIFWLVARVLRTTPCDWDKRW